MKVITLKAYAISLTSAISLWGKIKLARSATAIDHIDDLLNAVIGNLESVGELLARVSTDVHNNDSIISTLNLSVRNVHPTSVNMVGALVGFTDSVLSR